MARRQSGGSSSAPVALPPSAHPMLELSGGRRAGGTGRTHCILAETHRQRGNRVVTNRQLGIRFVFLVITNTWAIGHAGRRTLSDQTARIGLSNLEYDCVKFQSANFNGSSTSFRSTRLFSRGGPLLTWIWSKVAWPIDFSWPQSSQGTERTPIAPVLVITKNTNQ